MMFSLFLYTHKLFQMYAEAKQNVADQNVIKQWVVSQFQICLLLSWGLSMTDGIIQQ